MTETVDIIFFGAHPDDVELSAGGTAAKCVKDGLRIGIVDLTRGEMGTRGTPQTRKKEAQRAAKALGATFRQQLDFQDGNLQTGREQELEIIELLRIRRPKLVIGPWPDDRHPDHSRTGRIVTEASFYAGLKSLQTGAPAHRPQTVLYYLQNYMITPSFVVDVLAHLEDQDALRARLQVAVPRPEVEGAADLHLRPEVPGDDRRPRPPLRRPHRRELRRGVRDEAAAAGG